MKDHNLTSGPGKLCIALAIDRGLNGKNLRGKRIRLEDHRSFTCDEIAIRKRIGRCGLAQDRNILTRYVIYAAVFNGS